MNKYLIILLNVLLSLSIITFEVQAQDYFYYSHGKKNALTISDQEITLKFKANTGGNDIQSLLSEVPAIESNEMINIGPKQSMHNIKFKNKIKIVELVEQLKKKTIVESINPVFILNGGMKLRVYDHFVVQFNPTVTKEQIDVLNKQHNVEVVSISPASPNLYVLKITQKSDLAILDMANLYYENTMVTYSLPDYYTDIQLYDNPNDLYFSYQYYLQNTGQTGGVSGADINVIPAWDITKSISSITVAVIDAGGSAHEDLPVNRIVSGYDYCYGDNDPSAGGNEAHGMACAGIVAASQNNNIGISGIAPNSKIMFVRIFNENSAATSNAYIASAIDFAWQNNADVISNSWGFNYGQDYWDDNIAAAINRAMTNGRNGRGSIVVFASSNNASRSTNQYGYVTFPATISGVIAVGAIDKSNIIQNYSPRGSGTQLAVVAPTGDLEYALPKYGGNQLRGDVWSLDIPGEPGWNSGSYGINYPTNYIYYTWISIGGDNYPPGNYTSHFGGTSAACPQVSGVAALLLSVNQNLSVSQIKNIICNTAIDLGTSGYDTDYGYGRLNAYKALKYTLEHYGGTFDQDVMVPSGDTWNIQSGVTLSFTSNSRLIVNGTLNASGTSSDSIKFLLSGSSGYWGGLQFNNGSGGSLNYCSIKKANMGINFNNTGYASISVRNSTIQSCSSYGVNLNNSSPSIYDNNHILSNGYYGIYCGSYSSPYVVYSMIKGHSVAGIYCNNYSSPIATRSTGQGNNVIKDNTGCGLYANYNCVPAFGNSSGDAGYNSIFNNSSYEVRAEAGSTVNAQYNWWGANPPDNGEFYSSSSTIYNQNYRGTDPNNGRTKIVTAGNETALAGISLSVRTTNSSENVSSVQDSGFDSDITNYEDIFKKEKNTPAGRYALIKLEETFNKAKKNGFEDFVNKEIFSRKDVNDELTVMGLELINHSLMDKKDFKTVVTNLEKIKSELLLNEDIEKNTLFTIGSVYFNSLNDKATATKYFAELKQKYPKDILTFNSELLLGNNPDAKEYNLSGSIDKKDTKEITIANTFELVDNYPNPFNPTTNISFSLPQRSNVKLVVYDALGKEVTTLANGMHEAGKYNMQFNGSSLSSGMYFYTLTTSQGTITKKMLLVK